MGCVYLHWAKKLPKFKRFMTKQKCRLTELRHGPTQFFQAKMPAT